MYLSLTRMGMARYTRKQQPASLPDNHGHLLDGRHILKLERDLATPIRVIEMRGDALAPAILGE